jgi:hypothetical protein
MVGATQKQAGIRVISNGFIFFAEKMMRVASSFVAPRPFAVMIRPGGYDFSEKI